MKNSNRQKSRKIATLLIGICMMVATYPREIHAAPKEESTGKVHTINLNVNGFIDGITAPASNAAEWKGSRLYLGSIGGTPLLWRVLDENVEEISDENVMLIQTDSIVTSMPFDQDGVLNVGQSEWNEWKNSDISLYLNEGGKGGFLKGFGKWESELLYEHFKEEKEKTVGSNDVKFLNPKLDQGSVFLLSAEEATENIYGYGTEGARKMTDGSANSQTWWLRSTVSEDSEQVGMIDANGSLVAQSVVQTEGILTEAGIAPAAYLDMERILFTTLASSKKPEELTRVSEVTTNLNAVSAGSNAAGEIDCVVEWKLTVQACDTNLSAIIEGSTTDFERHEVITLKHSKASSLTNATQVSALITDEDGQPVYYGRINNNASAVQSTITVPSDMAGGNYLLYVFAEVINSYTLTDYASSMGSPISFTVSEKETPTVTVLPSTGEITYGQTLADSQLTGGKAMSGGVDVPGFFQWGDGSLQPSVSDGKNTEYKIEFIPNDTDNYNIVNALLTLTVKKAFDAPGMPDASMTVGYVTQMVKNVSLPEGWSWKEADAGKSLPVNGTEKATAVYFDSANYDNYSVDITIYREACVHSGGTATCIRQAICSICSQPYGTVDNSKHGSTAVKNSKEATCTEKGYTGDTYCKDCSQVLLAGKAIELSSHYYNNSKTLKWIGCVQQGEIQYYCDCGDSYVVITPAWGHDYKSEVTTKATAQKTGIKTFTCTVCGHQYTESIHRLSSESSGENSSGGNGNAGGNAITNRLPFIKGNSSITGWTDINKEIGKASSGGTVRIGMNDSLILPEKTLDALKGKEVTLILDIGNDMSWSIYGMDITSPELSDINLKVTKNGSGIPAHIVEEATGSYGSMQLSLVHEGSLGCTAVLEVLIDGNKVGYYANLFYYNQSEKTLEYVTSSKIGSKGIARLPMTHASEYLIIIDPLILDSMGVENPEIAEQVDLEVVQPEETPYEGTTPVRPGDTGFAVKIIVIAMLLVLGTGILVIVVMRARKRGNLAA